MESLASKPYPTLIPQPDVEFPHLPLPKGSKIQITPFKPPLWDDIKGKDEFPFYERFRSVHAKLTNAFDDLTGDWKKNPDEARRKRNIISATRSPLSPFINLPFSIRRWMDPNAPVTNGFVKLFEMLKEPEIMSILMNHVEADKKLDIMCLAEAPGTFPIAILCWLANNHHSFLNKELYDYKCTTLEPPEDGDGDAALGDKYTLIDSMRDKWIFMDHTSVKDTKNFENKLIKPHSYPLVTGDIGISLTSWLTTEREMCGIQLGQMMAACISLTEGGTAVLKMFTMFSKSIVSILRMAMHCFKKVRIFKPRTSHQGNSEAYWILSGFKVEMFEAIKGDIYTVMGVITDIKKEEAELNKDVESRFFHRYLHVPGFLNDISDGNKESLIYPDWFKDRVFLYNNGTFIRQIHCNHFNLSYAKKNMDFESEPFDLQLKMARSFKDYAKPYIKEWLSNNPMEKMGKVFYDYTGVSNSRRKKKGRGKPT